MLITTPNTTVLCVHTTLAYWAKSFHFSSTFVVVGYYGKSEWAKGSSVCKVKSNIQNKWDFQTTVDRRPW